MRHRFAISAVLGLSICAVGAPALSAGAQAASRGTTYSTGQIQRIGPAALQKRLTDAKGIGLVQKLKVVARVRTFTEAFYWYHKGRSQQSLAQLRGRFNVLHRHIANLVKDDNPQLHADLVRSRAGLWQSFANARLFRTGFGRGTIKRLEGRAPELADSQGR
jgi:hypothetical protein